MKQHLVYLHQFSLNFAKMLMKDLPEDRACELPIAGAGHPVWIIGHLALAADGGRQLLGHESQIPANYRELFGRGTSSQADPANYPSLTEVFAVFEQAHARLTEAFELLTDQQLAAANPNEELRELLPTLGDMLIFMMTMHESLHLGQLSWWRRAIGLPPVV